MPGFLARRDLPLIELPPQRPSREVAASMEETASSRLSLEAEIDQFHLEEDKEERANPIIQLPDSEDELDRQSAAHSPRLIIACVDSSSEEDEKMDINPRRGLKGLLFARNKGGPSKDAPKSQVPSSCQSFTSSSSPYDFSRIAPLSRLKEEEEGARSGRGRGGSLKKGEATQKRHRQMGFLHRQHGGSSWA